MNAKFPLVGNFAFGANRHAGHGINIGNKQGARAEDIIDWKGQHTLPTTLLIGGQTLSKAAAATRIRAYRATCGATATYNNTCCAGSSN